VLLKRAALLRENLEKETWAVVENFCRLEHYKQGKKYDCEKVEAVCGECL
jgi:hypothetical protein